MRKEATVLVGSSRASAGHRSRQPAGCGACIDPSHARARAKKKQLSLCFGVDLGTPGLKSPIKHGSFLSKASERFPINHAPPGPS